ncbi:hypothetical protein PILCRDRAFT_823048 [Piloderma croceum F 1598]|uniref:Uncharacterized protein n=1 Tax=Piloderma croceum (strain F 1598) TaxID=765440 RepID=A0A0C3FJA7_PILCF|nr:hypothetical protein PILCRDRAFT_823048 [Piloderma croceum F 1598]
MYISSALRPVHPKGVAAPALGISLNHAVIQVQVRLSQVRLNIIAPTACISVCDIETEPNG